MRNKLVIKFWNEQIAEVSKFAVGDKVQIRNAVIQVFNGVKSVSSTEDTEIEVQYDKYFFIPVCSCAQQHLLQSVY